MSQSNNSNLEELIASFSQLSPHQQELVLSITNELRDTSGNSSQVSVIDKDEEGQGNKEDEKELHSSECDNVTVSTSLPPGTIIGFDSDEDTKEDADSYDPLLDYNGVRIRSDCLSEMGRAIGKGSFGSVYKATYKQEDGRKKVVAVKVLEHEIGIHNIRREIMAMHDAHDLEHVVRLEGIFICEDRIPFHRTVALVMPLMSNGNLWDYCCKNKLTVEQMKRFSLQAAIGIKHLHERDIIHRDLACRNLLLDENMKVHVADLGQARMNTGENSCGLTNDVVGPICWEAPECWVILADGCKKKKYSKKTDVFSYGVCVYEIVSRKKPWERRSFSDVQRNVSSGIRMSIPTGCDGILAKLMDDCWKQDPNMRPSIEQIVEMLTSG